MDDLSHGRAADPGRRPALRAASPGGQRAPLPRRAPPGRRRDHADPGRDQGRAWPGARVDRAERSRQRGAGAPPLAGQPVHQRDDPRPRPRRLHAVHGLDGAPDARGRPGGRRPRRGHQRAPRLATRPAREPGVRPPSRRRHRGRAARPSRQRVLDRHAGRGVLRDPRGPAPVRLDVARPHLAVRRRRRRPSLRAPGRGVPAPALARLAAAHAGDRAARLAAPAVRPHRRGHARARRSRRQPLDRGPAPMGREAPAGARVPPHESPAVDAGRAPDRGDRRRHQPDLGVQLVLQHGELGERALGQGHRGAHRQMAPGHDRGRRARGAADRASRATPCSRCGPTAWPTRATSASWSSATPARGTPPRPLSATATSCSASAPTSGSW